MPMFTNTRRSLLAAALVSALALLGQPTRSFGGATDIPQQGARGSGMAEAFSAQPDDASAIFYNPAGLTQLHGSSFTDGGTLFFPYWNFQGNAGQHQSMNLPSLLPYLYVESDFGLEKWRFGFGINNVFGLNEDWGDNGPLRTLIQHSHLYTINLAPSVAYEINDHLSVGVDMNIYWGDLELSRNVILGAPPTPEGHFHFRGQDAALGATPGVMWKIDDRNTIGAVYRSPFELDYSGQARVKAPGLKEIGPSHAHADFKFPQMATLAYAMRPVRPLKLEADVVWTDWNVVQQVPVYSPNPAFRSTTLDNWKSGFSYHVGVQYDLTRNWALRAGYAYGQSAIPTATFSPLVPDSNYHLFSVGVGYSKANWSIDAAYQYIYRETRHISGNIYSPVVDGTWDNNFNELMVSLSVKL